ncbi:hypothetical protein F2Q68_00015845 [Brassica cretica]|nr:hypothetical protein F2Q68_00015845 [Brassica cretica]
MASVFKLTRGSRLLLRIWTSGIRLAVASLDSSPMARKARILPLSWSNGSCSRLLSFGIWAKVLRLKAEDSIQSIDKTGVDFVAQEDQKVILPQGIHPVAGTFKGGRACERCATEYVYMFILGTRSE